MAKDRRQKAAEKRRQKKKKSDARQKKNTARAKDRQLEREKESFGSTAYCWPVRYRSLFFSEMPDMSESINFSGVDLHMSWFPTQEARQNDQDGEIVTSLRIDSSRLKRGAKSDFIAYDCKANLATQVLEGSAYGDWYRQQWGAVVTAEDGEEWQEMPVEFELQLRRYCSTELAKVNRYMDAIDSIPYVANCWNVTHIVTPKSLRIDGCALDIDRVNEILFMLRIWTPILTCENFPLPALGELEQELAQIEATEFAAAQALTTESELSQTALAEYEAFGEALHKLRDDTKAAKEAFDEAVAAIEQQKAQEATLTGEALRIVRAERKRAERQMYTLRDRHANLAGQLRQYPEGIEVAIERRCAPLMDQFMKEFKVANEFTRSFLHWQRTRALLSLHG